MIVEQSQFSPSQGWQHQHPEALTQANLVLYFCARQLPDLSERLNELRQRYPDAVIAGCSTGGEIAGAAVVDDSLVATAIAFEKTTLRAAREVIRDASESREAGARIAKALLADNLRYVLILSDGLLVNGSDLVTGLFSVFDTSITVTGGLAGDGADFTKTLVGLNDDINSGAIVAIGLYGTALCAHIGSGGGWETFGPSREITRASGNVLYELDNKPALDLYKQYLGEEAAQLPGSALLFPLAIHDRNTPRELAVRTILAVDENEKSMTFAGDIPQGCMAKLMHASFSDLVDGAEAAALSAIKSRNERYHSLALLISCIGRKLLLGPNISDETEVVTRALGASVTSTGFYSYGEISHSNFNGECSLFNQTMTITLLYEEV